jgi:integrase/recombinase XerD
MHLQHILNDFLSYIETERGYGNNTKTTYERAIKKLLNFLRNEKIEDLSKVDSFLFTNFIKTLQESGLGANSIRLTIESCRTFFKFLKREGMFSNDPIAHINRSRGWKKIPDILTISEVETIINRLNQDNEKEMLYRSIIELLYGSGLRVSELCNMRVGDFQNDMVRVLGKGGKERLVPYSSKFIETVKAYWKRYRKRSLKWDDLAFINVKTRSQLNRFEIGSYIKRHVKKCGITKNISPHSFRHAFATHLIENGANIRVLQEMMGHASINSTDIYVHLNLSHVVKSFNRSHPRL